MKIEEAMELSIQEAQKFLGATSPNPPVGAVALDSQGRCLAVCAHEKAGEAHAEVGVLDKLRRLGKTADTLVVTLEPCNHRGKTGPCTEAIIQANVPRVVIGTTDPNPGVCGGGISRLQASGIEVIQGVMEKQCKWLIRAFAHYSTTRKPWVTLKCAFQEDGEMQPPVGQKTFTSQKSLAFAHGIRKRVDAILTGSGTVLSDDPDFTVRHVADHVGKRRFLALLDRRGRVARSWKSKIEKNGFTLVECDSVEQALLDLGKRGVQEVLVEAGPSLRNSFLKKELWNECIEIHKGTPDRITVQVKENNVYGNY